MNTLLAILSITAQLKIIIDGIFKVIRSTRLTKSMIQTLSTTI